MPVQLSVAFLMALLWFGPAQAQPRGGDPAAGGGTPPPATTPQASPPSGPPAPSAAPTPAPTPPSQGGNSSGTAPGGMGSTAWSGGKGGSFIGTTQAGPTPGSPNTHPSTASGLDPTAPSGRNEGTKR